MRGTSLAKDSERTILRQFFLVEVELFLSIGWSWRIREVGWFSRNRVVLVFDPKDGWLVVGTWLVNDGQDKDGWSADEGESGIPACRGSGGAFGRRLANCVVPTPFG